MYELFDHPREGMGFLGEKDVEESDLDRFKKYTRPVVKTKPKIERTTNPAGRTNDHVEWKVTTPTGEIHRYKSKKQAQAHFDSFGSQGVAEGLLNEFDYNKHVKMLNAYMKKLGYSYIGHGTDAHVFSKEAGSVTKVLIPKSGDISTAKNPFLAFLNYCKKNAGNPHLPKFTETTKEPIQLGSEKFDQVVMERLQEVDPKYEDLLVSITDSIEDGKPLDPQYQPYIKFYQTLKSVMLTGRKLGFENDIITFQSVNIMQRGNTLVIIDPWTGKGRQGVAEGKQPGKPVVDAIQKVLPVAQEIWFHGSRATGKHRRNSDTDILVVVPDDLVGDQYLAVVRILQKLASHFDNYDIQPTKSGTNIHRIAQEEGRLLWSSKQGVAEGSESGPVEAYGYRYNNRDQRIMWRKIFPSGEAAYAWADRNNATVLGTRSTEQR